MTSSRNLRTAFPAAIDDDVAAVLEVLPMSCPAPTRHNIGSISILGEHLEIPFRTYSPEGTSSDLAPIQSRILACLYTRHNDGFVRQRNLERILPMRAQWEVPFVVQLLGEYVIEIIEVAVKRIGELQTGMVTAFVTENRNFCQLTTARIVSYWSCYYSARYPRIGDYPGYMLARDLGVWSYQRRVAV